MVKKSFSNKVILITGGSSGLVRTYTNFFKRRVPVIACSREETILKIRFIQIIQNLIITNLI